MRHWVKVRLQESADAVHAYEIVEYWRRTRSAAVHLTKAIRMYYQLTGGDTTLLKEYFPFLVDALGRPQTPQVPEWGTSPAPPEVVQPKSRLAPKSAEDDLSDFLDNW